MKRLLVIGSLLFFLGIAYVGYAAVSVPDVTSLKKTNPTVTAMMEQSGIVKSATQFGLGVAGLVLITFAAVRLGLQPGAVSLLRRRIVRAGSARHRRGSSPALRSHVRFSVFRLILPISARQL